jgi:polysaccharide biosynthesis protein PslH
MEPRKKVLFITTQLPYPPVSGGVIKSWKLCEMLAEHYDLGVACLLKNNDAEHISSFREKVSLKDFLSFELQVPRTPINLLKANLMGIPLNLFRNRSKDFRAQIAGIAGDYDVLFIDHYEMYQYVPKNYTGRVVLHQHNCEYLLWERFGELEQNAIKKFALFNQAWHIRKYEKKICKSANAILAAPNDKEELVKIGAPSGKFYNTYHLGDTEWLQAEALSFEKTEQALFFVGTLTWEANVDGLIWMLKEVWPLAKMQLPDLQFYIVGKHPDTRLVDLVSHMNGVHLEGFREDLEPYYQRCRVFVAPLRFGSGIKVKVMNALYRGIPTITTSIGAEGLQVVRTEHIWIAETPQQWVDGITTLMEDKGVWERISSNSRQLAATHYTWGSVMEKVREAVG